MEFTHFLIAIAGIAMPIGILAIIFGFSNRSEARFHETVQKMIDNGQELSEEILSGIPGYKKVTPKNDLRDGTNTVGVGIGLVMLGFFALGSVIMGVGLLVACIGGAMILNGYLNRSKED